MSTYWIILIINLIVECNQYYFVYNAYKIIHNYIILFFDMSLYIEMSKSVWKITVWNFLKHVSQNLNLNFNSFNRLITEIFSSFHVYKFI